MYGYEMVEQGHLGALIASIVVQSIEDLKTKDYTNHKMRHRWWYRGCPRKAKEFILSSLFIKLCGTIDFDGESIRKKLKEKKLL